VGHATTEKIKALIRGYAHLRLRSFWNTDVPVRGFRSVTITGSSDRMDMPRIMISWIATGKIFKN
jgi:hypothetical protein